jgi:hypothetical protein
MLASCNVVFVFNRMFCVFVMILNEVLMWKDKRCGFVDGTYVLDQLSGRKWQEQGIASDSKVLHDYIDRMSFSPSPLSPKYLPLLSISVTLK